MDVENPIRKDFLFVTGDDDNLVINIIGGDREGHVTNKEASNRHEMSSIMSQIREL